MQLNLEKKKLPSEANLRLIANLCIALANKQSALEDKTVAPWKADTTYQKDVSYVSYNGYLWLCTITNTDSEFNEAHWQKLSDNITELSKDDIAALINLTPEQVTALQTLIDDDTITATKTYSSSKIYAAINDAIAECKDDTLKQIAKKVSGAYKIASSTSDVISTDYIYLISNGNTYDLYVLVGSTPTKVGDTNIDLSDYLKSVDAESTYLKKTDAEGTYAKITDMDKKVDKTNISTAVSSSSTDDQVASAKAVYDTQLKAKLLTLDEVNDYSSKLVKYGIVTAEIATQIGIPYTNGMDLYHMIYLPFTADYPTEIFISVAGDRRVITRTCDNGTWINSYKDIIQSSDNGEIILERLNSKRFTRIASWDVSDKRSLVSLDIVDPNNNYNTMRLQFDNETGDIYKFFYNGADQTWVFKSRYCQTTVADIPLTTITTFLNENIRGKVCYSVRNGICYVSIQDLISSVEQYGVHICALPKPYDYSAFQYVTCVNNATDNRNTRNSIYIDNYEGVLTGHFTNTIANWASFSYPVAES